MDAIVFSPLCVLQVETSLISTLRTIRRKRDTKDCNLSLGNFTTVGTDHCHDANGAADTDAKVDMNINAKSYKYQRIFRQFVEPEKSENRTCLVKHMKNHNRQMFN